MYVVITSRSQPILKSPLIPVFGLPPSIVNAALGDIGVEQVAGLEAKVTTFSLPQNID